MTRSKCEGIRQGARKPSQMKKKGTVEELKEKKGNTMNGTTKKLKSSRHESA